MTDAEKFASMLGDSWLQKTKNIRYYEVHLFRALIETILSLSNHFHIEEYHGSKHQVAFGGYGSWARDIARCEMSDLLIVTFRTRPKFCARATFLQAKRSLDTFNLCNQYPMFNLPTSIGFKVNLEQWDLLSRRPTLIGVPPFDPPPEILKDAVLPSIGSFGVFHKRLNGSVGFLYTVADALVLTGSPVRRYGRLELTSGPSSRTFNGIEELRLACCIGIFGQSLFDMRIGTPLNYDNVISSKDGAHRDNLRMWLSGVIREHLRRSEGERREARMLLSFFEQTIEGPKQEGPLPNLLLIRTESRNEIDREA